MAIQVVNTEQGTLEGVPSTDGRLTSFKGVPFASPPVGRLRWRPPQPPEPWSGVRIADAYGLHCPQPPHPDHLAGGDGTYGATGEDCLYLNVWTAAQDPDERRPVMVYVHHGGFFYGGSGVPMFDGDDLARAGIVLVTVNYRFGRLGFLAHPELGAESDQGASGHYGLLDQIAALQWVKENIAGFGGDPDCVTLWGQSAGSQSANLLTVSPLARGLFHRVIAQSGGFMAPPAPTTGYFFDQMQDLESAEGTGVRLATALGCRSIEELRARSPQEILEVSPLALREGPRADDSPADDGSAMLVRGMLDSIYPALDGYVVPRPPADILAAGEQIDVPLLTGSNAAEWSGLPPTTDFDPWIEEVRAEYGDFADRLLDLHADKLAEAARTSRVDRLFVWPNWAFARGQARSAGSSCFYYHWSYVPSEPEGGPTPGRRSGAYHGVELPFVFRHLDVYDWPRTQVDREVRDTVSSYWLNFARTGDPNGNGLPAWEPLDADRPAAMHLAAPPAMGEVPRLDQMEFWDDFYTALRGASRIGT